MENENKNSNQNKHTMIIITIIVLLVVCLTGVGIGIYAKNNFNNNKGNDNSIVSSTDGNISSSLEDQSYNDSEKGSKHDESKEEIARTSGNVLDTYNNLKAIKYEDMYYFYANEKSVWYSTSDTEEKLVNNNNFFSVSTDPDSDYGVVLFNATTNKFIGEEYDIISCNFHSDVKWSYCNTSRDVIIVQKDEKYGLISLEDGHEIISVNNKYLSEDKNGNFIASDGSGLDNNSALFDKTGKEIIKTGNKFIGNIDGGVYLIIENNILTAYDKSLNKIDIGSINKKYSIVNFGSYSLSNYYHLIYGNINSKITVEDGGSSWYFTYKGNDFTGDQYILFYSYDICGNDKIDENTKAYIINPDTGKVNIIKGNKIDTDYSFCF